MKRGVQLQPTWALILGLAWLCVLMQTPLSPTAEATPPTSTFRSPITGSGTGGSSGIRIPPLTIRPPSTSTIRPPTTIRPPSSESSHSHSSGINFNFPVIRPTPVRPVYPDYHRPPNWDSFHPNYTPNVQPVVPVQPILPVQPNVLPQPNVVPVTPVQPVVNLGVLQTTMKLSAQDLQVMKQQTKVKNAALTDKLREQLGRLLADLLGALPGAAQLTAQQRQQIEAAARSGGNLAALLNAQQQNDAAGKRLLQLARLFASLQAIQQQADAGTLELAAMVAWAEQARALNPPDPAALNAALAALRFTAVLVGILGTAVPGDEVIPVGNTVTIVLVPGMPRRALVSLGNGTVLIGLGCTCDMVIGTGSVAGAMGMVAAAGDPVPESQAEGASSGTLVRNPQATPITYNVNAQQFSLTKGYVQTLPAGATWVIEFDRGGTFGTAKYTLSEGTYDFTPTQNQGWEVYLQAFKMTLDNSQNRYDFHYVLNNQAQVAPAQQRIEHSGAYPMLLRFDNGKGQVRQKQVEKGEFRVAVAQDNALDLFSAAATLPPAPPGELPAGFKLLANPFLGKPKLAADTPAAGSANVNLFNN